MSPLYLLDTNIMVHLVRGDAVGQRLQSEYSLAFVDRSPLICGATEGEIRSLAYQFRWGTSRVKQSLFYLAYFKRVSIDQQEIYEAYAAIDAYSVSVGRSMGKNDIWIAATAYLIDATLLTTDKDFDHLASRYLSIEWIDPSGEKGNSADGA